MSSLLVIRRVWIEKAECTGHTLCVPEAPGLIVNDERSDVSVVQEHSLERTQHNLKLLLEAEAVCPMSAFFIEVENGDVFNLSNDLIQKKIRQGNYRWA
jgi:ferredoxin